MKQDIDSIIQGLGIPQLKQTPRGYKGCCFINPNHIDNKPSMHISIEKGLVKCFSCGAFKTLFEFLLDNGVAFDDAIDFLFTDYEHKERVPQEMQEYTLGRKIPKSMIDRGFEVETLKHFKVGYDDVAGWITIPCYYNGKLYGIVYRQYPKTMWSSEGFVKDRFIYNYEPTAERVYVEGQTDTWMTWQNGSQNVSSCLMAFPSEGQLELMAKHKHLILAMDNDKAGFKGVFRIHKELGRETNISIVKYRGSDPGACKAADWQAAMKDLKTFSEFEVALITKNRKLYDEIMEGQP